MKTKKARKFAIFSIALTLLLNTNLFNNSVNALRTVSENDYLNKYETYLENFLDYYATGDTNRDSVVDSRDYKRLLNVYFGNYNIDPEIGDIDGNNVFNIVDLITLKNTIVEEKSIVSSLTNLNTPSLVVANWEMPNCAEGYEYRMEHDEFKLEKNVKTNDGTTRRVSDVRFYRRGDSLYAEEPDFPLDFRFASKEQPILELTNFISTFETDFLCMATPGTVTTEKKHSRYSYMANIYDKPCKVYVFQLDCVGVDGHYEPVCDGYSEDYINREVYIYDECDNFVGVYYSYDMKVQDYDASFDRVNVFYAGASPVSSSVYPGILDMRAIQKVMDPMINQDLENLANENLTSEIINNENSEN